MEQRIFNQDRFRELLRKGIGSRTQKEFAEQTGLDKGTINRMLNNDVIQYPKTSTLEILAMHMQHVTLAQLLEACGYEVPAMENVIMKLESDISDFFAFAGPGLNIFNSMLDITSRLEKFLNRSQLAVTTKETPEQIPEEYQNAGAENILTVKIKWNYDKNLCVTTFEIYYTVTKNDRIILIGSNIDDKKEDPGYTGRTIVKSRKELTEAHIMEKRLLAAIFGEESGNLLPVTRIGYGFEYNETPAGFVDFLNSHAETFCDSEENILLYNRIVSGEDPEEVFDRYFNEDGNNGTGAVVSSIMKKETGKNYLYYEKDCRINEESRNACVMFRLENEKKDAMDRETLLYLYECARTLKVDAFGMTYYRTACIIREDQIYKTDRFWLEIE